MGKYWKKALKILQKEYKKCPDCGTPTTDALLCASCDHMHCVQCDTKMTRIPSKIAKKARNELDKEASNKYLIASISPKAKKVNLKEITDDPYFEIVQLFWMDIVNAYNNFVDKNPIILYDIQENRIYVYPFKEFILELTEPSQLSITQQYMDALVNGQFIVFVRDNKNDRLVSYTVPPKTED